MNYRIINSSIENEASKELLRRFSPLRIHTTLQQGYNLVGDQLEADTHRLVPHDTGELARSYKKQLQPDGLVAGYDVPYASYQEAGQRMDGTNKIKNRPAGGETGFLTKTLDKNMPKYIDILKDTLLRDI